MPRVVKKLSRSARRIKNRLLLRSKGLSTDNVVLIYQMGKVASSAIYDALSRVSEVDAYHVHRMNPDNIREVRRQHREMGMETPDDELGLYLNEKVIRAGVPARVITLVREPVGRNVSAYFENMQYSEAQWRLLRQSSTRLLREDFFETYPHDVSVNWFDVEMNATLGVDVYSYDFPKNQGHSRIQSGLFELLILRHDLSDSQKGELIGGFLGIEPLRIARENVSASKDYGALYKEFVARTKLPSEYVHRLLNSRYARHFFPEEELSALRRKWIGDGAQGGRST